MATEPEKPLTIWQRLLADSPAFWKKVNYIGLALGAIVAAIQTNVPTFPKTWLGLMAGISVGLVAASQFAVKDTSALAKPDATVQDYINLAGDLQKQYAEVKSSIEATVNKINIPTPVPADTPVVKDAIQSSIIDEHLNKEQLKYYNPLTKLREAKLVDYSVSGEPVLPLDQSAPVDLNNPAIPTATLIASTPAPKPDSDFSNPNPSGQ